MGLEPIDGLTYQLLSVGGVVLQWNRPGMRNRPLKASEMDSRGSRKLPRFRYVVKRRRVLHFSSSFNHAYRNNDMVYLNEDAAQEDARRAGGILDSWSLAYSGPQTVLEDSGAPESASSSKTSDAAQRTHHMLSAPHDEGTELAEHICWQYSIVAWNHVGPSPPVFTPTLCFETANVETLNHETIAISDSSSDMECWHYMQAFIAFFGAEIAFDSWLQPFCAVVDATSNIVAVLTSFAILLSILQWAFGCCPCMWRGKSTTRASDHSSFMETFNYATMVSPPNSDQQGALQLAEQLPDLSERPHLCVPSAMQVPNHSSDSLSIEISSSEESAGPVEAGRGSEWIDCAALPDPVSMNDEHNVDTERYTDLQC